jgi:hypothetical protein
VGAGEETKSSPKAGIDRSALDHWALGERRAVGSGPAVFKNEGGADYVAVAGTDNHAQLKTVQTGMRNTDSVQVTSGLKEGEPVITSGGYALPDKTPIKIEAPTEKGSTDNRSEGSEKGKGNSLLPGSRKSPRNVGTGTVTQCPSCCCQTPDLKRFRVALVGEEKERQNSDLLFFHRFELVGVKA